MVAAADGFRIECLTTLRARGIDVEGLRTDRRGNRHLVFIDPVASIVHRFPYQGRDAEGLVDSGRRHDAARALGLPAPAVLDVHSGMPGSAYMTLEYVAGRALDEAAVRRRVDARPERLATRLVTLLDQLRGARTAEWPFAAPEWSQLWDSLPDGVAGLRGQIPEPTRTDMLRDARAAARIAATCPLGLIHGDLGGVNLRVRTDGDLTGVLDWDGAVPGDTAMDTAALLWGVPRACRAAVLRTSAEARADMRRWPVYRATWAAQGAIWAAANDRPTVLADIVSRCSGSD